MRKLTRDETIEFQALQNAKTAAENHPVVVAARAQAEQQAAARNTENAFRSVFSTVVELSGKKYVAVDSTANRQMILSFIHPGESVPDPAGWWTRMFRETPALAKKIAWQEHLSPAQKILQQKEDQQRLRERFELAAKTHGLALSDANFNIWSSVPDAVVSVFNGQPCILLEDGNTLALVAASQQEIDQWRQDFETKKANAYQEQLKTWAATGNISELRKAAAAETQQKQLTSFEVRRNYGMWANFIKRQEYLKEPLPSHYRGQPLTADTIKKGGVEVIKDLGKRCGFERINALLYGLGEDFFVDAEAKLKTLAAEEYHELSFSR